MMRVKVSIMARRCSAYFPRARIQMNRVAPAASVPLRLADTLFPTLPIVQPARSPVAERNVSSAGRLSAMATDAAPEAPPFVTEILYWIASLRSEEHTSELQSPCNLVCRLLLEKKKRRWPGSLAAPWQYSVRLLGRQ